MLWRNTALHLADVQSHYMIHERTRSIFFDTRRTEFDSSTLSRLLDPVSLNLCLLRGGSDCKGVVAVVDCGGDEEYERIPG